METLTYLCVISSFVMLFVGLFRCFFCHGTGEYLDKHKRIPKCDVAFCHGDWPWGDFILAILAVLHLTGFILSDEHWFQGCFILVLVLLRIYHKLFSIYVNARDLKQLKEPCEVRTVPVPAPYRNPYNVRPAEGNLFTSQQPVIPEAENRPTKQGQGQSENEDDVPEVKIDGVKERIAHIEEETSREAEV